MVYFRDLELFMDKVREASPPGTLTATYEMKFVLYKYNFNWDKEIFCVKQTLQLYANLQQHGRYFKELHIKKNM